MTISAASTSSTSAEHGLRILHLSDTHLYGDDDSRHYGIVDTRAALARVLDRAAELDAIDVVIASGDLSEDGSGDSYRRLHAAIEPWAIKRGADVVYAMGNHDQRAGFEAVLGERTGVSTVDGFRIVRLDSSVPGAGYGEIEAEQLDWLRGILAESAPNGTVLVLHHPPVPASSSLLAALELRNPRELLEVCGGTDVRIILSGHYHHSVSTAVCGIPVVVAPGITNTTDALAHVGTERATVGSGFALIEVPAVGAPRTVFVAAPSAEDGREIYNLTPVEVEKIVHAFGPQR